MRTRAERRRCKQVIWDRRAKLYYQIYWANIPCEENGCPIHNYRIKRNHRWWRPAENWKEYQKKNPSMLLYKNTGTIWDHNYWSKYERHRLNKQSRMNAKLDLKHGEEIAYERTNLK